MRLVMANQGRKVRRGSRAGKKVQARKVADGGGAGAEAGKKTFAGMDRGDLVKMISSWDAARHSERRGRVVMPSLNPKKRVSPTERLEIARKVEAAEQNVGFVKRAIEGPARLVGNLLPQSLAGNADFEAEIEEKVGARFRHPRAFDAAGTFDFNDWQAWVRESKIRSGDCLTVLAEGPDGAARVMCYEGTQIGDGMGRKDKPGNLYDGVFLDRFGGRAGFQLLDEDGKPGRVVPRDRAIYHSIGGRAGRVRSVSGLAHAVANFLDMVEILADTKHAVKVAALWGAWIEQAANAETGEDPGEDLRGFLQAAGETAELAEVEGLADGETLPDGNILSVEDVVQGGRFQEFAPGRTMKTMNDSRPHPNVLGLLSWLIRDMAWGLPHGGLSPEVLWDASSMNGPGMRFVMAETRRFVADEQERMRRDCQKLWMYFAAKEAQRGNLTIPAELAGTWYRASWIPQADLTIDRGRDGKLDQALMADGLMTREEWWARQGKDWKTEEAKVIREEAWIREQREAAGLEAAAE